MKKYLLLLSAAGIFSCNNGENKSGNSTTDKKDTTLPATQKTISTAGGANTSFLLNGQPAIVGNNEKNTSTYFQADKYLTIYLQGYIAPDTYAHQLAIMVKDFAAGTTGIVNNATTQFSRKDEARNEFVYGNRATGSFKLTITKWENVNDGPLVKARISGTFEGDMNCETCFDPAVKGTPFAQPQHITSGTFVNVRVAFMK